MKQTAVEWLIDEMNNIKGSSTNMNSKVQFLEKELNNLFEQAKEMAKGQIIDAWDKRGDRIVPKYFLQENITGEQYYNENFKSE